MTVSNLRRTIIRLDIAQDDTGEAAIRDTDAEGRQIITRRLGKNVVPESWPSLPYSLQGYGLVIVEYLGQTKEPSPEIVLVLAATAQGEVVQVDVPTYELALRQSQNL